MKPKKFLIIFQAISRMSRIMLLYMVRRTLRNYIAIKAPIWYKNRLSRIEKSIPTLSFASQLKSSVQEIGDFYCAEYGDQVADILSGKIVLHGRSVDFKSVDRIDWKIRIPEEGDHQMWSVKLGHMGFLCPLLFAGSDEALNTVLKVIRSFRSSVSVTDPGAFNTYWFPYGVSHRVLALTSGYLIAASKRNLPEELKAEISKFLQQNVAFIIDNIEYELGNNHIERNLAALCIYFSHTESVPDWIRKKINRDIRNLLDKTILADGGQIERSPMYQGLSIASQSVWAETPFLEDSLRQDIIQMLAKARHAFSVLCHPDGEVALFNDSWHHEVPVWRGPAAPAGRVLLSQSGYARLATGLDVCILDAGALGPRWNPGHGHADFLSIEISLGGKRLVVDPGTSRYNTGAERGRERSAAAHNGPVWKGYEPVSFLGCFKIGRMAEAHLISDTELPFLTVAGIFRDGPGVMIRVVKHYPDQGFLIADIWNKKEPVGQLNWLIPSIWSAKKKGNLLYLSHHHDDHSTVFQGLKQSGESVLSESFYSMHYGRRDSATQITITPEKSSSSQSSLVWIGHSHASPEKQVDGQFLIDQMLAWLNRNN